MTGVAAATRAATPTSAEPAAPRSRRPLRPARIVLYVFLTVVALGWLAPMLLAVYASLRPYQETAQYGYFSWPRELSLDYYQQAWSGAEMPRYFRNTFFITVPAVLLTLFFASFVAFALARFKIPGRRTLLVVFTAGNLLPPQVM
ncbi:hypothetical protein AB0H83_46695 [Dactylosporangium sp. NPDC050688]|uniref:hypothetical protein n=1 Tax=Dactylosporangium sp. NPDC050688 TaxID=3157217 RepID=UPI0033F2D5D5